MPVHHAAEAALVDALARAQRLHAERAGDDALHRALLHLADWQSRRLLQTYADLASDARYRAAIDFFRTDLYGNETMARRDADVARVVPTLVRMLPERVIATIAQAMELNVLSHTLDREVQRHLPVASSFTVSDYCEAYRCAGDIPARHRQIHLIVEVGRSLDSFVRKPLLRGALTMMRKPARLAGFSTLHDFLERGFNAFRRMHGAEAFLATIEVRETALCNAIVAGETAPFPEP
ncbi:MAG TPA: hypothetical protein VNG69_08595 [Casimicrobiaceae bacterium]|nr:hypothetical protein [Casimicrobiaceae bacterium]